jgi:hypothetical protein
MLKMLEMVAVIENPASEDFIGISEHCLSNQRIEVGFAV